MALLIGSAAVHHQYGEEQAPAKDMGVAESGVHAVSESAIGEEAGDDSAVDGVP